MKLIIIFTLMLLFYAPFAAMALEPKGLNPDRNQELEITASQTLEWHRNNRQYIARGDVVAKQGDVTITADVLTADYRETSNSAFEIYRLSAKGNVKISAKGNVAYGQKAVYDVDRAVAVMTGDNLRLAAPNQSVTAQDSFEYWVVEGRLKARGKAHVIRMGNTLEADILTARFSEDASGTRQLKSLTANDNVRITTLNEVLTGENGTYSASSNIALLSGHVKITRGPNILEGARAEVNLSTNVSKMLGSPSEGERVRGVFYPESEKKQEAPPQHQNSSTEKPLLLGR